MTRSPKEVLERWVQFMNDHDVESLVDLYDEEAYAIQVAVGLPLAGKDAIRRDLESFFANVPDSYTKVDKIFQDGDWAIIEWTGGGHYLGKKKFTLQGCGFFQVIGGKIRFQRGYWDKHTWFSQVGIPLTSTPPDMPSPRAGEGQDAQIGKGGT